MPNGQWHTVRLHDDLIDILLTALDWYEDDRAESARYGGEDDERILANVSPLIAAARDVLNDTGRL